MNLTAGEKLTWSPLGGFSQGAGPSIDDLVRCVHCGLCLNACPTQRVTGLEMESPRGRISLMRAVHDGRIDITEAFHEHMDLCLVCRSCETACPSGVRFGRLMEATRADLWHKPVGPRARRLALHLAFEWVFPYRSVFLAAFTAMRAYQRSGLQRLVRRSRLLERMPGDMATRERSMPDLTRPFFRPPPALPSQAHVRVGFVSGCVMSTAFADVQEASVRVLERFGCSVVCSPAGLCCGALNVHAGERSHARRMALRLMDAMRDVDVVVINSAGCGSVMKEYADLFEDDPALHARASEFAARVRDFSEVLVDLPAWRDGRVALELRGSPAVAYQDACHLRHAQRVIAPPRELLGAIAGVRLVELQLPDQCCGSAGMYNVEHPSLSRRILDSKLDDIRAANVELVVSANPGCILQLRSGLDRPDDPHVEHIATVLDRALVEAPR
jgi:glycolate oxidase iron-sulfur subunit